MRAVMLFLLIAFHAGISYMNSDLNSGQWLFKDSSTHIFFDGLVGLLHSFRLPAFFVISGFVTHRMFRKTEWKKVLITRFNRLFFPMLITIVLISPLVHALFAELLGQTNAWCLDVMFPDSMRNPLTISTIHVWFLYYLLLFTALHLAIESCGVIPLLKRWKTDMNFLLIAVIIVSGLIIACLTSWQENLLFGEYTLAPTIQSLCGYLVFYLLGILLSNKHESFAKLERMRIPFLLIGITSYITYSVKALLIMADEGNVMEFNPTLMVCSALTTIFLSLGLMGCAMKYYKNPHPIILYISKSSYFIYLIHFPVLIWFIKLCAGYNWNVFVKFIIVLIATCFCSLVLNVSWIKLWRNNPPI